MGQTCAQQVISIVHAYPTRVQICLFTDNQIAMQRVLATWEFEHVALCSSSNLSSDEHPYAVVWEHRAAMVSAMKSGLYTSYINLEGDFKMPWSSLLSWATDTAVLAPMGFQRGFYATEFHPDSGQLLEVGNTALVLVSHQQKLNITSVQSDDQSQLSQLCWDPLSSVLRQQSNNTRHIKRQQLLCPHKCYIQLPNPYTGFWVATHAQLEGWTASAQWKKEDAMSNRPMDWGYAETAAGSMQFVNVPQGFLSASVVPYDCHFGILEPVAGVPHVPNRYAAARQPPFSSTEVTALLQ